MGRDTLKENWGPVKPSPTEEAWIKLINKLNRLLNKR